MCVSQRIRTLHWRVCILLRCSPINIPWFVRSFVRSFVHLLVHFFYISTFHCRHHACHSLLCYDVLFWQNFPSFLYILREKVKYWNQKLCNIVRQCFINLQCAVIHSGFMRNIIHYNVVENILYTVSQKMRHYTLVHSFAKYWPIFKILSPSD